MKYDDTKFIFVIFASEWNKIKAQEFAKQKER